MYDDIMDWNTFKKRPKIGLALGGGGPRGLGHLGVINVLQRHNIPIDCIAGTSAGSIAGAFYAAKKNTTEIEKYILDKKWWDMLNLMMDPSFREGILQGKHFCCFLEDFLGENLTFDQLHIPFIAVSVNLQNGNTTPLHKGSVVRAVLASCAAPLLFKPVKIGDDYLVDGGLTSQVPVKIVKKMGADIVIAVNLTNNTTQSGIDEKMNFVEVSSRAIHIMLNTIASYQVQEADIVINPDLNWMHWRSLLSQEEKIKAIKKGEEAMEKQILHLQEIMLSKTPFIPSLIKKMRHLFS